MSSDKFEAFSEAASDRGESASDVEAFLTFWRGEGKGSRVESGRLPGLLGLDPDVVGDLLRVGEGSGLLVKEPRVFCPACGEEVDKGALAEGFCPACSEDVAASESTAASPRYRLSDAASDEARARQAERRTCTAVIITAIIEELDQVKRQLERRAGDVSSEKGHDGTLYYHTTFPGEHVEWDLYASCGSATNPESGPATASAIFDHEPRVAILLGVAGGIKDVDLGDVVAATTVHDYDGGKEADGGYIPRTMVRQASHPLEQVAVHVAIDKDWTDHIVRTEADPSSLRPRAVLEPIAGGGKVVANPDSETFKLIRRTADRAVAVEMEGSAFLAAVRRATDTDGIVIRGISDLIAEKSRTDALGWQGQAAANAAAFALQLLYRFDP